MANVVFYAVAATIIFVVIASLLIFLFIQRRRHRVMQLLAMAQEDAERRRRNRKKAGLRRWEIDSVCPEAVFTHIASNSTPRLYKLEDRPAEYISAVSHLPRTEHITKPDAVHPAQLEVPPHAIALPDLNQTCVICIEDVTIGQHVRVLPCHHVYHAHCIRVWLRRKNACPCCCEKVIKRRRRKPHPTALAPVRPVRLDDRMEGTNLDAAHKNPPDDVETSFDRFNSESSCQQDEPSAAELLFQVRRALRGESSTISLNTSVADLEESLTCRSVPDLSSFGRSSVDPEEGEDGSGGREEVQPKPDTANQDDVLVHEKPEEIVIDLESNTSTEYITPPPERFFPEEERV